MRTTLVNRSKLHQFRFGVFSVCAVALLMAPEAWAQLEVGATAYFDFVNVSTPGVSEDRGTIQGGLMAGYQTGPWSVSAEYVAGGSANLPVLFGCPCREIERNRAELTGGYSVFDSLDLTAGVRVDEITISDTEVFWFFFFPVPVTETQAELDMTHLFVGANYESDPLRKIGLVASARLYRGFADVSSSSGSTGSDDSEGFRTELGMRMGPPDAQFIAGVAYESFKLSDAASSISSEPVVFLQYRYTLR